MREEFDAYDTHIIPFISITFLLSWLLWLPSILNNYRIIEYSPIYDILFLLGAFSPSFAAFILLMYSEGMKGVLKLWNRAFHYYDFRYFLISLFLIPGLAFLSLYFSLLTEGSIPDNIDVYNEIKLSLAVFIGILFLGGPLQEEFGWRGYALEHFLSKYDILQASVITGVLSSFWHIPLFYIANTFYINRSFFDFFFPTILTSVIFTWLYIKTDGSILVAMVFHATINSTYVRLISHFSLVGRLFFSFLLDIIVVMIILFFKPKNLLRNLRINNMEYKQIEEQPLET